MKEQSHKEEMSSLVKADFERLRARGVATTLAPGTEMAEPDRIESPGDPLEHMAEIATPDEQTVQPEPSMNEVGERPRGWLRRLVGSS